MSNLRNWVTNELSKPLPPYRSATIRMPSGKAYHGKNHGEALQQIIKDDPIAALDAAEKNTGEFGFTTQQGDFHDLAKVQQLHPEGMGISDLMRSKGILATLAATLGGMGTSFMQGLNDRFGAPSPETAALATKPKPNADLFDELTDTRALESTAQNFIPPPELLSALIHKPAELARAIFTQIKSQPANSIAYGMGAGMLPTNPKTWFSPARELLDAKLPPKILRKDLAGILKGASTNELEHGPLRNLMEGGPPDELLSREEILNSSGVIPTAETRLTSQYDFVGNNEDDLSANPARYSQYTLPGGKNYREILLHSRSDYHNDYGSPHWGDANPSWPPDASNIIGHIRMNDRVIDGKKTLFLEELQSDAHQKGRTEGYQDHEAYIEALRKHQAAFERWQEADSRTTSLTTMRSLTNEYHETEHALYNEMKKQPKAPFSKNWPITLMKRAIHEGVHGDYERIAWTSGQHQAARYNMGGQVDELHYDPRTQRLMAYRGNNSVANRIVSKDELPQWIGHEATKQLLAQPLQRQEPPNGWEAARIAHRLSIADLKVSHPGMTKFYDAILPIETNKYIKQYGGQVGRTNLRIGSQSHDQPWEAYKMANPAHVMGFSTEEAARDFARGAHGWDYARTIDNPTRDLGPVHFFDITPKMRETIKAKGQPLSYNRKRPTSNFA